jgi:hypothetical protein
MAGKQEWPGRPEISSFSFFCAFLNPNKRIRITNWLNWIRIQSEFETLWSYMEFLKGVLTEFRGIEQKYFTSVGNSDYVELQKGTPVNTLAAAQLVDKRTLLTSAETTVLLNSCSL